MEVYHVDNFTKAKQFNSKMKSMPTLVLFYMPWCGHCNAMKPDWDALESYHMEKSESGKKPFLLGKVHGDYTSVIDTPKSIIGYPTIYHIMDGELKDEYNGPRDFESFKTYLDSLQEDEDLLMVGGKRKYKKTKKVKTKKSSKRETKQSKKAKTNQMKKSKRQMKKYKQHSKSKKQRREKQRK